MYWPLEQVVGQSLNLLLAQSPKKTAAILWASKALGASLSQADVMLQRLTCTGANLWHNSISSECRVILLLTALLHGKGTGALGHVFS